MVLSPPLSVMHGVGEGQRPEVDTPQAEARLAIPLGAETARVRPGTEPAALASMLNY